MRGLKLRQLETFSELARQGSLALTANKLSLTQSAVSLSIRELERQLGQVLFEKQGRRLVLSDRGRELLPDALDLLERAHNFSEGQGERPVQALAIGATRSIGPALLPRLIRDFEATQASRCQFELYVQNTEAVLARLRERTLDLAFIEGDVLDPDLNKQSWLPDQLVIFCRAKHPILSKRNRLTELSKATWALRETGSGTRETFLRAMVALAPTLRIGLETTDNATLAEAVAVSDRLGCLSRRTIANALHAGSLVEIKAPSLDAQGGLETRLIRNFWLVRDPLRHERKSVQELVSFASAWAKQNQLA